MTSNEATWHIIASEYPPQPGGVSDYTQIIATELAAAGEEVHVWTSRLGTGECNASETISDRLFLHRELGRFSPSDLNRAGKLLDKFRGPRRLLVQWVPHSYGYKSMNVPFCLWLWRRARLSGDRIELMVHEPFLAFGEGSQKQNIAAAVHRFMLMVLLRASSRVWVSIPEWETHLRPFTRRKKLFVWLPVPNNISVVDDPDGVVRIRKQYTQPGEFLVGHFGAYNQYMNQLMSKLLPELLTCHKELSMLLVGNGSLELQGQVIEQHPDLAKRVHATGALAADDLSRHIGACNLMLQPYQDGVSGRRGSVMTALAHGMAVVTTQGKATEEVWVNSGAVLLTQVGDITGMVEATLSLLSHEDRRVSMGKLAAALYQDRFDVRHTVSSLRCPST
jgi:glycosyltransferase involved in cell wall biosynthesis